MMSIEQKRELKIWMIYFGTILIAGFLHETGHCIPAWVHGYWAVPTPAKEYIRDNIPVDLVSYVSLGGITGTAFFLIAIFAVYLTGVFEFDSAILAGALAMPGMYTLRFALTGRGHDATEFQEAQAALGLNYNGHALDWIILALFISGVILWIFKSKPGFRISGRLLIGFILTIIFVVALQTINNAVFDPLFKSYLLSN